MRVRLLLQAGMMVLLAMGLTRCQQPAEKPAEAETPPAAETPPQTRPAPRSGTPQALGVKVKDMQKVLRGARRLVREGSQEAGALELNKAADLFAQYAAEASDWVKEDLEISAAELSGLAQRFLDAPSISQDEIDAALTRAFWALAAYNYQKAAKEWTDRRRRWAAAYLRASSTFIDEAVGYFSGGLEMESVALLGSMRGLAGGLAARGQLNEDDVTARIEDFGQKVETYNRLVRQAIETNVGV